MRMVSILCKTSRSLGLVGFLFVAFAFSACQNPLEKVITTKIEAVTETALESITVRTVTGGGATSELPEMEAAFYARVMNYSLSVDPLVTKVSIAAKPEGQGAGLAWKLGDGSWTSLAPETFSDQVPVLSGTNRISIRVSSENGLKDRIYSVNLVVRDQGAGRPAVLMDASTPWANQFGHAVVVSDDNLTMAAGDNGSGHVHVYSRSGIDVPWLLSATLYPEGNNSLYYGNFGYSLAISGDGKTIAAGRPGSSVYMFTKAGDGSWIYTRTLSVSSSQYGCSVAISHDGSAVIVGDFNCPNVYGSQNAGAVYFYRSANWASPQKILSPETNIVGLFGRSVAISADGTTAVVGAPLMYTDNASTATYGAFYVYTYSASSSTWIQAASQKGLESSRVQLGSSVAISSDGHRILAGAIQAVQSGNETGAAYLYSWDGFSLSLLGTALPAADQDQAQFGLSVALSADGLHAAVGAPQHLVDGKVAGAVFRYDVGASGLSLDATYVDPYPVVSDSFGYSVDIGSDAASSLCLGAMGVDYSATDLSRGAVYIY